MPRGDNHFEEHIRTRTANPPAVLYKYTTVDTARTVFSDGKIRFQSPLRYNDPFDSKWDVFWPTCTPEAIEHERALIKKALMIPESWPADADPNFRNAMDNVRARILALPESQRESAIAEFVRKAAANPNTQDDLARRILDIRRRMRILCLSALDESLLMWSHYADQHRGVALGFDTSVMENSLKRPFEPVKYCDSPPRLIDADAWSRSMVFGLPHPELTGGEREWAITKHTDWNYEREWRIVTITQRRTADEYEDFAFPRDALVEVVLGCRTDPSCSEELLALVREIRPEVRHFRMTKHNSRFELIKTEMTDPPRNT